MRNPAAGGGARLTDFMRSGIGGRNTTARSIAQALPGSIRNGNGYLCRCPVTSHGKGRGDRNPSLSIADGDDGKLLVRCFAGCNSLDVLAELRRRGLTDKPKTSRRRDPFADHHRATAAPVQGDEAASRRNCAFALRIWAEAIGPRGTLAEAYLQSRALELPDEAAIAAIRFHPTCRFGNERMPAMVCLVRNIRTDEPQSIHRTALTPDGIAIRRNGKTFRMSLGPVTGGAIKLDPDEDVTQGICIGEGVETCLAGRQMGLRPVWSAISKTGVASFPVLPGLEGLHILRDDDSNLAGAKAAEKCFTRWRDAGREVVIVEPDAAKDLNDELRGAAE